jgi:flavin reductase (DIM6/NTAB) family NADH-FMN oxidoreductase RutF
VSPQAAARAITDAFTGAMSNLVSGLGVITARRSDGEPCGILVSSMGSYSIRPPSVLVAVDRACRSFPAFVGSAYFGSHVLAATQQRLATIFASGDSDKFASVSWAWDGAVPQLLDVPTYLTCRTRRVFEHGDHAILIGDVVHVQDSPAEPLVYYRRRSDWRISVRDSARADDWTPLVAVRTPV